MSAEANPKHDNTTMHENIMEDDTNLNIIHNDKSPSHTISPNKNHKLSSINEIRLNVNGI